MCGIFCLITPNDTHSLIHEFNQFKKSIARRGPNALNTEIVNVSNTNIFLAASVLWLRGNEILLQPLKNDTAILLYNGEMFGGFIDTNISDTQLFFDSLNNSDNIIETLSELQGPYAFIYYNKIRNTIYFGRDIYGRRSLLIGLCNNEILLTSVARKNEKYNFIELPCLGIFSIDLCTKQITLTSWKEKNKNFNEKLTELCKFLQQTISVSTNGQHSTRSFVAPNENLIQLSQLKLNNFHPNHVQQLKDLLKNSIKKRVSTQPKFCQNCFEKSNCDHAITGVLFSGGVDCAILALLLHNYVDFKRPIDLINVAFEKNGSYNTPDRLTGLATLNELKSLCPERKWNFVEVNVTLEELNYSRNKYISNLIYPLKSILDDSLGCALWFASRAVTPSYTSPCRTLIVGMGADELFGGYTRHRAALQNDGWERLHEVLEEDWENLPHRNLGRDDRVVSDHGRQLRTPYLDEEVVKFVRSLHSWEKTLPVKELPQGVGEKILLRALAYDLGLQNAATFKKRALQFGSRIANSREKGHEISDRL